MAVLKYFHCYTYTNNIFAVAQLAKVFVFLRLHYIAFDEYVLNGKALNSAWPALRSEI